MWAGDFELIENHVHKRTLPDEKGLLNGFGENNCFLNVVIQALWHLEPFRAKFLNHQKKSTQHHPLHNSDDCISCALESIFMQYQFSDSATLPPTALRETLAILFKPVQKFQLKQLDDASEALEAVLERLHGQLDGKTLSNSEDNTYCKDVECIPHKVFGLNLVEQVKCHKCGAVSAPLKSSMFTTYTYAASLKNAGMRDSSVDATFCQLLNKANMDQRYCPNKEKCDTLCKMRRQLTHLPEIFSVGVVWDSDTPTLEDIAATLKMISLRIDLSNVFNSPDRRNNIQSWYKLRGMICYYGKHYIVFLYNERRREWMVYDDVTVKGLGNNWVELQQRMIRGKLQPSVLFYECEQPQNIKEIPWKDLVEEETVFVEEKPKEETERKEVNLEVNETTLNLVELGESVKAEFQNSHSEIYAKFLEIVKDFKISAEHLPEVTGRITELFKDHQHVVNRFNQLLSASERNPMAPSAYENVELKENAHVFDENRVDSPDRERIIISKMQESVIVPEEPQEEDEVLNTLGDSFVFIPKFSNELEDVDFIVIRTNWMYKRQVRRLRFKTDCFIRVLPGTGETLESFEYKDILDVTILRGSMIIRFYSGKETQYYESERVADMVEIIMKRSAQLGHKPVVKYS
eukprot:TRINITY_DN11405_c0_g1_i1.p1 TRINITY_DN11405_c0_g1~~TRINITY_DN11405_c0_g1_i1.p1  ORF type:complete len:633 (-),score=181.22 TRINITY_DN11405_c0_g1_i1:50-1948(-)